MERHAVGIKPYHVLGVGYTRRQLYVVFPIIFEIDVVGTNSYGKGTVQQTKKLLDGSMIKYTTQKWLTPNGNSIDGVGVVPTNYVELSDEYLNNTSEESDNQIIEAFLLVIK